MRRTAVLASAATLDLVLGEPPNSLHPVAWFGRLVSAVERRSPRGTPGIELAAGTALAILLTGAASVAGLLAARGLRRLGGQRPAARARAEIRQTITFVAEAWLLKITLAVRGLFEAARAVQMALERGDPDTARHALRNLVSRETGHLSAPLIAAAAIESVAENASDSIVAPALAYLAFGLPGAAAYRAINTLDAMIGYRGEREWIGKAAATLDDLANLVPARLTAGLVVLAATARRSGLGALAALETDHDKTSSPNAGWPMSAVAGALGVQLEKVGHYRLGAPGRPPTARDVGEAIGLVRAAIVLGLGILAGLQGIGRVLSRPGSAHLATALAP